MRIVHYLHRVRLEEGGTIRAGLDMCKLQAKAGHKVRLLTYDDTDVEPSWRSGADGCPEVVTISPPARPGSQFSTAQLAEVRSRLDGFDVMHLHGMWVPSNPQLAATARKAGVPYVLSIHGMLDDWSMAQRTAKKRLYLALRGNRMLRHASRLHTTAVAERDQASRWTPVDRASVIPYIFDHSPFENLPGPEMAQRSFDLPEDRPAVLFLSRLHYKKGAEVLIEAAARLKERGSKFVVLFAGSGDPSYEKQLRDLVTSQGVEDCVRFLGMVKGEVKASLYEFATVLALPTSQENFGIVFPESLACGTPVITTKGVDIWVELEAAGAAVITDPTAEAFADAIDALLSDPERVADMGRRGREWVYQWLDASDLCKQFDRMYAEAAGSRLVDDQSEPAVADQLVS